MLTLSHLSFVHDPRGSTLRVSHNDQMYTIQRDPFPHSPCVQYWLYSRENGTLITHNRVEYPDGNHNLGEVIGALFEAIQS